MPDQTSPRPKGPLLLSVLIITMGAGWLLTALGIGPGINWVWTLGLGVVGVMAFVVSGGADKFSIIVGPFFLVASLLSVLRQRGVLALDVEVPLLVILIGVLSLIAQTSAVPFPRWMTPETGNPPPKG